MEAPASIVRLMNQNISFFMDDPEVSLIDAFDGCWNRRHILSNSQFFACKVVFYIGD